MKRICASSAAGGLSVHHRTNRAGFDMMGSMSEVEIVVEGYARGTPAATFSAIVPVDLTRILTGLGPLPAVIGTREQSGPWDHVGATRIVELSDGSEAPERITAHEPGRYFAYRVGPFTGPLRFLASHADGAWWFSDFGERGTHIRWSYTFALTGPAAWLVRPVLARAWRAYARRVLGLAIAVADA
jgi:hypothetical protein